jgi:hypothetical protein
MKSASTASLHQSGPGPFTVDRRGALTNSMPDESRKCPRSTPASRTLLLHRISLKILAFWLYSHPNNPDRSRRSRGYSGLASPDTGLVSTEDYSVGCGDMQSSQIASSSSRLALPSEGEAHVRIVSGAPKFDCRRITGTSPYNPRAYLAVELAR